MLKNEHFLDQLWPIGTFIVLNMGTSGLKITNKYIVGSHLHNYFVAHGPLFSRYMVWYQKWHFAYKQCFRLQYFLMWSMYKILSILYGLNYQGHVYYEKHKSLWTL